MNVPDKIVGRAQERLERWLAFAPAEQMTVWRDDHLNEPRRRPVLADQAAQNRLEVFADLDALEFAGAVLADLIGIADGEVVWVMACTLSSPTFRHYSESSLDFSSSSSSDDTGGSAGSIAGASYQEEGTSRTPARHRSFTAA